MSHDIYNAVKNQRHVLAIADIGDIYTSITMTRNIDNTVTIFLIGTP